MKKIGVVGCGLMGSGIAQVSAQHGFDTVCLETEQAFLDQGMGRIQKNLDKLLHKGKISEEQKTETLNRLHASTELKDLADCDIVIEAITEKIDAKIQLFQSLDELCKPETIFASNTSSLKIMDIAAKTKRQAQFLGMHFFNPVPIMKLVEVICTEKSSEESFKAVFELARQLGKDPVRCQDNSGFIVNLLLVPFIFDAIRAYERGIASAEDIDKGMVLGCGHPMGPLTLADFVGLDTLHHIGGIMFREYGEEKYQSPKRLQELVEKGHLGKKSGQGFYTYNQ